LREVESPHLEKSIEYATWRPTEFLNQQSPDRPPPADDWSGDQRVALHHVVHTLDILGMGGSQLDFSTRFTHATATLRGRSLDVLAVSGPSHEACLAHVERRFVLPPRHQLLLVTRDPNCTKLLPKQKSFLHADSGARFGAEPKITDVDSAKIHVGFGDLIELFVTAANAAGLEDSLYARLTS